MKLKQIIPLQGKFTSTTSPTSGEAKLPGFLKFLKSQEIKKEATAAVAPAATRGSHEKSQSPSKSFNPGKLFNFGKESPCSEQQAKPEDASRATNAQHTNDQNPSSEELSSEVEKSESSDFGNNLSKKQ